jgi:L-lactate dehydrogenase complex protein LldF
VQLGNDRPSHILVPAIHRNRAEIRDLFRREMPGVDPGLTDEPRVLAMAARAHLRARFLTAKVAVSGANFASPTPAPASWSSPRATAGCA